MFITDVVHPAQFNCVIWLTLPCQQIQLLTHSSFFDIVFIFPFLVSPWCWNLQFFVKRLTWKERKRRRRGKNWRLWPQGTLTLAWFLGSLLCAPTSPLNIIKNLTVDQLWHRNTVFSIWSCIVKEPRPKYTSLAPAVIKDLVKFFSSAKDYYHWRDYTKHPRRWGTVHCLEIRSKWHIQKDSQT